MTALTDEFLSQRKPYAPWFGEHVKLPVAVTELVTPVFNGPCRALAKENKGCSQHYLKRPIDIQMQSARDSLTSDPLGSPRRRESRELSTQIVFRVEGDFLLKFPFDPVLRVCGVVWRRGYFSYYYGLPEHASSLYIEGRTRSIYLREEDKLSHAQDRIFSPPQFANIREQLSAIGISWNLSRTVPNYCCNVAGMFLSRTYFRRAASSSALHSYCGEAKLFSVGRMISFFVGLRSIPPLVRTSTARTILLGPG
ncbi:hypothetical protein EVAR_87099_1 [Eumeta japonica]|uniref:Uncharacterized protein n=1 Tax=Eumeta variegata TaxID=151549 RepID=A0A4C1VNY1_EUMVA|nr:hypothetical protein EVAR_87099_1 [Eumeta japonica]